VIGWNKKEPDSSELVGIRRNPIRRNNKKRDWWNKINVFYFYDYIACELHAGYLRLQTHAQNM